MNLLSSAEKARFYWQKLKYKKANDAFKKNNPDFPLPPEFFIYETYRLNYKWYYEDGKNTAAEILKRFSPYISITVPGIKILDWGCGPGRIIRHFPELLPGAEIFGIDYNEKYIQWCKEHLKGINFSVNKIFPPANFADNFFDIVTGLSVFTHLSEKGHHEWIDELYRLLKPGRFALITTQGTAYYTKLTDLEKQLFDTNNLVIRKHMKEGNRLFSSFQPMGYVENLLKGKFKIIEFLPGKLARGEASQDTWLIQKT